MAWGKSAPEGDRPSWLARIEANDAALRSVHVLRVRAFDEATQIATAKALEAREAAETEWWDAREAASDSKLISYQKTDHYVKRAATVSYTHLTLPTNREV